jgi:hypothetical protein
MVEGTGASGYPMPRRKSGDFDGDLSVPEPSVPVDLGPPDLTPHQLAKGFALDIPSSRRLREGGE